ncbi:2-oxoglutarate dehydrogenase E1 component [Ornithobacterium rhinotracheale]|uniref:2-oxoglutarate dehydrogenase E1 component n=1 Tax=Ornithobacterium rhinotracheale TaxID=28251 RepID=UPI00129C9187|nr:2-oxoglutarate dehydrogenase E1 component [Ornithobacterium rhinotracheale]MRJ07707.1 2-oxoglutarate dehydrogenase E1 component [Ornithobacterium rhinotracheale]MRJ10339.1 2-oxoglutarate dehydrogenase E1 component [Ornithobacterium rhinotracheale]UOH78302.1 2-oxoglutarate dehydrogenase E1 component [Ornithobacterium rhinotracheale]
MERFSFLNAVHAEYIDELYQKYKKYPDSVDPSWRSFFQGFDFGQQSYGNDDFSEQVVYDEAVPEKIRKEFKVVNLINGYRSRGHLFTKTNPVRNRRTYRPTLALENFGLSQEDLNTTFDAGEMLGMGSNHTLAEIIDHLEKMYCQSIGVEYMYIRKPEIVEWIQQWLNKNLNQPKLTTEEKRQVLHKLNEATAFEDFLHKKFVGQKRFSGEGVESVIPGLDEIITRGAEAGVQEYVVGMAHRGRLNVLANVFKKNYSQIFSEFEKKEFEDDFFDGDVKYHLGSTTYTETPKGKKVKINLAPNPSHLETVDAVVEGIARAKADLEYEGDFNKIIPILLHGDAAISGQGIVYEVVQMEKLKGYKTGGTIHIVTNNQIGFTTNYLDGRSSTYCTDVAKVTLSPVLHVNADDVEAVIHAMRFAVDYRMQFNTDVFIDLLGYRKYGHNEGDEPRFTQPKLYKTIAKHPNVREIYKDNLEKEGVVGDEFLREMEEEFRQILENHFEEAKKIEKNTLDPFMPEVWEDFELKRIDTMLEPVETKSDLKDLKEIAETITKLPSDKKFIKKVQRLYEQRNDMVFKENSIDWGMAELLAYGSLLKEGFNVRISGEDVERGTFSHRHALVKTEDAEEEFILLNSVNKNAQLQIYNSLLSEYAVLGFDYGYAMAAPKTLSIWEAQFGDFSNGGQIVIDQYISAAEDKWKMQNGLVMLLPHGYEGQGAEHSSARVERYLQLCARGNMFVANCTTPANFYHLLRRQMHTNYRKPLVVFTPKSLLRHPQVKSSIEELAEGTFQPIIDDTVVKKNAKRLVFCTGKVYYDLLDYRKENKRDDVAIIRLEQLYPLNIEEIKKLIKSYKNHESLVWVQEEPENMGAWSYILRNLRELPWEVVAPHESAAPATGSFKAWYKNQQNVINETFNLNNKK